MSNKELWNNFLENIKNEITNVSFETWFNEDDTKFYSFENGVVIPLSSFLLLFRTSCASKVCSGTGLT